MWGSIAIDLVFVFGPKMTCFECGWSISAWFLCAGVSLLRFSAVIEIGLVCVQVFKIELISVESEFTLFQCKIGTELVIVYGLKMTWL